MNYSDFLREKTIRVDPSGFLIERDEAHLGRFTRTSHPHIEEVTA